MWQLPCKMDSGDILEGWNRYCIPENFLLNVMLRCYICETQLDILLIFTTYPRHIIRPTGDLTISAHWQALELNLFGISEKEWHCRPLPGSVPTKRCDLTSPHFVMSSNSSKITCQRKDHQIISQSSNATWIRREALIATQLNPTVSQISVFWLSTWTNDNLHKRVLRCCLF